MHSDAQQKAICHVTGPALVLAGPGSGKTRVITERIKYLTNNRGISPENILVVTFTKAAAIEMKQRYMQGNNKQGIVFGTFHSIFFFILKHAYRYTAKDILTEGEKRRFIQAYLQTNHIENENETDLIGDVIAELSKVKSERYDMEAYFSTSCGNDEFRGIVHSYQEFLRQNRKLDFDDMMIYTYDLFCARPDILHLWQDKFQYILIDEFQDINALQYDIIQLLAQPKNNLFIVGDDDQSIYSFRGSKPSYMLQFEEKYKNAVRIVLDINYRCSPSILEAALHLINHNEVRFKKALRANKSEGEPIDIEQFEHLLDENKRVVEKIGEYKLQGVSYNEMAILYRTNVQPQALVQKLMEYNIPIRMKDGMPNIYEHWIARDLLAYIRMALGARDKNTFYRVMNRPKRYISKDCIGARGVDFNELAAMYEEKPWMCDRIFQMESDLRALRSMPPSRGLRYIDKVIGYGDFLEEYALNKQISLEALREVYDELLGLAQGFKRYEDLIDHIDEYTKWCRSQKTDEDEAVTLMTMHGSKGLEYEVVFVIDVVEGVMPHHMSVRPEEIEEERRMFYVAMTRAKNKLHLYHVKNRYNQDCEPSRFLSELRD